MNYFKTEGGEIVKVLDHTLKVIKENPDVRITIGTDSQDYADKSRFVTCICYRWARKKGAHYIYLKEDKPRYKDTYSRLYQEGTKTLEIASLFEDTAIKIEALEFDFNNIKKTESTKLISGFKGWCEGTGYKALFKGDELVACRAADHKVRGK